MTPSLDPELDFPTGRPPDLDLSLVYIHWPLRSLSRSKSRSKRKL